MDETLTPDEESFMRWLDEDVVGHEWHGGAHPPPHWEAMREEVERLGSFLRLHLPAAVKLPDPALFNKQVQALIADENAGDTRPPAET